MKTKPERSVAEIVEETKTNFYKRYSDKVYPKKLTSIVNELSKEFTQTLQAERQKRDEMVSRIATFAEHRATCFLYNCEDEKYQNSKCDCGLYNALTQPPHDN